MVHARKISPPLKNFLEQHCHEKKIPVYGIDEAGRGCFAGPVVVGAASIPKNITNDLLRDSKQMTEAQRNKAYEWITSHCLWTVAVVSAEIVDAINIYQATMRGMLKVCAQLDAIMGLTTESPRCILIDAMPLTIPWLDDNTEIYCFPKGETHSSSIAAASIVAKVTRDRIMNGMQKIFPCYSLEKHKGYGTGVHSKAIQVHGASVLHRRSFIKNLAKEKDSCPQVNIFGF
ncbi:ribonuclease HII [bacterium]|nr:ribonuclease HII [bacterium]